MNSSPMFAFLWCLHTILESLPISSSAHIELINRWFARRYNIKPLDINTTVSYVFHIPTLFVIGTYLIVHGTQYFFPLLLSDFSSHDVRAWFHFLTDTLIIPMVIANTITFACMLLLKKIKKPVWPLSVGFFISACALLSLLKAPQGTSLLLAYSGAAFVGLSQGVALFPGVSRLAITLAAGIWLGLLPGASLYYSLLFEFFLIIGALAKSRYEDKKLFDSIASLSARNIFFVVVSGIIAYLLLELMLVLAQTKTIAYFGWYLLLLSFYLFYKSKKSV